MASIQTITEPKNKNQCRDLGVVAKGNYKTIGFLTCKQKWKIYVLKKLSHLSYFFLALLGKGRNIWSGQEYLVKPHS